MSDDPLSPRWSWLRRVRLIGPRLAPEATPLWQLVASAPYFGKDNAWAKTSRNPAEGTGQTADHVHSLRVLQADFADNNGLRHPRLVDLHLSFGAKPVPFEQFEEADKSKLSAPEKALVDSAYMDETLFIDMRGSANGVGADKGNLIQAVIDSEAVSADADAEPGTFVHVVAEPLAEPSQWPVSKYKSAISVPFMRLVAGRICLRVALTRGNNDSGFGWLGNLGIRARGKRWVKLWLTPDGIEFDAALPFPGATGLSGRVLLTRERENDQDLYVLKLLQPDDPTAWLSAWRHISPDPQHENDLTGWVYKADRANVPAFRWRLDASLRLSASTVDVPGSALSLALRSPPVSGVVDGMARLTLPWLVITQVSNSIVVSAGKQSDTAQSVRMISQAKDKSLQTNVLGALEMALDDDALAINLRSAYGLPTPSASQQIPLDQPLLSAFVPIAEGWLQLPVPNLPPIDTSQDLELLGGPVPVSRSNVLEGFFRLFRSGADWAVLTGYEASTQPAVPHMPASLTLEGATGLQLSIEIEPGVGQGWGKLRSATIDLYGATIAIQGLLPVSVDRPDASEGLPRLGAGPGQFIAPVMRGTQGASVSAGSALIVSVGKLSLQAKARNEQDTELTVLGATLDLSFKRDEKRWKAMMERRGAQQAIADACTAIQGTASGESILPSVVWLPPTAMALAASMPMTRTAKASMRPLESRGLMAYYLPTPTTGVVTVLLASLDCHDKSLPTLDASRRVPVKAWPLDADDHGYERGVFFSAIGLPGVERCPGPGQVLKWALRYDLPTLDEAFASAEPPAVAPAQNDQAMRPAVLEETATALDWPALARFWAKQERKLQNARVVESYMTRFTEAPATNGVTSLIKGLTWPVTVTFDERETDEAHVLDAIPFGAVTLKQEGTTSLPMTGHGALLGLREKYKAENNQLVPGTTIDVLGFAPSMFPLRGVQVDNRLCGTEKPIPYGQLSIRKVLVGGAEYQVVSLAKPLLGSVQTVTGKQSLAFGFWFKDLLISGGNMRDWPEQLSFDVWDDPLKLVAGSGEWRLALTDRPLADQVLASGHNVLPFFGFGLEPLRLTSLTLQNGQLDTALIECRLTLGPQAQTRAPSNDRVTLKLTYLGGKLSASFSPVELSYALDCLDGGRHRHALAFVSLAEKANEFAPALSKLQVEVAGLMVDMGNGALTLPENMGDSLLLSAKAAPFATFGDTTSALVVESVSLTGAADDGLSPFSANVSLSLQVALSASQQLIVMRTEDACTRLKLCSIGFAGAVRIEEGIGSVSLVCSQAVALIKDANFTLNLGLIAGVLVSEKRARLTLDAGFFEARIEQVQKGTAAPILEGVTVNNGYALISARCQPGSGWGGNIVLGGELEVENAISWPGLAWKPDPAKVPLPVDRDKAKPGQYQNGRTWVSYIDGKHTRHTVTWYLCNHHMPLALAARIANRDADARWSTPVQAWHCLSRSADSYELKWASVENIAVGAPEALVPRVPAKIEADDRIFAPRYLSKVSNSEYNHEPEPGMAFAGRGAIATVLQGALGNAFRTAFYSTGRDEKVLIAGGFLGLVSPSGAGQAAPLLRIPVLAGLPAGTIAQNGIATPGAAFGLAWVDGPATQGLWPTRPTGLAPADASQNAVTAALLQGSRWPKAVEQQGRDIIGALLVEQSFQADDKLNLPGLSDGPFFLASAVTIARVMQAKLPATRVPALSLVAGYLARDGQHPMPIAAAILLAGDRPALVRSEQHPALVVLGEVVSQMEWEVSSVPASKTLAAYIEAWANQRDRKPSAALLSTASDIQVFQFMRTEVRFSELGDGGSIHFPDSRRGPLLMPDDEGAQWLCQPPLEGPSAPIRDYDAKGPTGSGVAGLSRQVSLPMQAGASVKVSIQAQKQDPALIWLSQNRVPLYLPLRIEKLESPPIGWLSPAPANVRLPAAASVMKTLRESVISMPETPPDVQQVQPIVPAWIDIAEVGERPGILSVRRLRLLGNLGDRQAIDVFYERFGRPGQAGASFARTLRTPRPGPLPVNSNVRLESNRNRRIQSSPLFPEESFEALLGSADTVRGHHENLGEWNITLVAFAGRGSLVSDRWDGTVSICCRVDLILSSSAPPLATADDTRSLLARLLLAALSPMSTRTQATLIVGDLNLSLLSLVWREATAFAPRGGDVQSAFVELVLDPRPQTVGGTGDHSSGPASKAIADALAGHAQLPPVELQWTVLPFSGAPATPPDFSGSWALSTATDQPLIEGEDRAPVTLRFPLYPVSRSRGALPMNVSSLLFNDPAYDRDLVNVPASESILLESSLVVSTTVSPSRGQPRIMLHADRGQLGCRETLTLMLDLRLEVPLDTRGQELADKEGCQGGDLCTAKQPEASIWLRVEPSTGSGRYLKLPSAPSVPLVPGKALRRADVAIGLTPAKVVELALARLQEMDGSPARLNPGDLLSIEARFTPKDTSPVTFTLWDKQILSLNSTALGEKKLILRLALTDHPTLPPPPALYMALVRSQQVFDSNPTRPASVVTALHAQSPLPTRVDLLAPAQDFRNGLMRRTATFVWALVQPMEAGVRRSVYVIKQDRNGQTWLPQSADDFVIPVQLKAP